MADSNLVEKEKVLSLFRFIKGLHEIKQSTALSITDYPWIQFIAELPQDPDIAVFYRDRVADGTMGNGNMTDVLLSVHKPEFEPCPEPDKIFLDFLRGENWENPNNEISPEEPIPPGTNTDEDEEYLADDPERLAVYNDWVARRNKWAEIYKIKKQVQTLFAKLYSIYFELQKDPEATELIAANGILCDKENPDINHPVLTKRVKLRYDAKLDTMFIEETDALPELYSALFPQMNSVQLGSISQMRSELEQEDYHPLDRNDTPGFLQTVVNRLSDKSTFSENGIPENWDVNYRLLLYTAPMYIWRKRLDGAPKAIENIIDDIESGGDIPSPIRDIVSGGKRDEKIYADTTISGRLAAVGGESIDIFLSKEANQEQLEIAERIAQYDAVLVQGPPGTGKTHTIANLMGHFLAQGKSILVTSHTTKALRVLKEKMTPGLQDLCVSVLEDSHTDMQKSVSGITTYLSRINKHDLEKEVQEIATQRQNIIAELAGVREKIFQILNSEYQSITYMGQSFSPAEAAKFVAEKAGELSYIPGIIRFESQTFLPPPLNAEELASLYASNEIISPDDEHELGIGLPDPQTILSPSAYDAEIKAIKNTAQKLQKLRSVFSWEFSNNDSTRTITCKKGEYAFTVSLPAEETVSALWQKISTLETLESWMIAAATDGKIGSGRQKSWELLIEHIRKTEEYAAELLDFQNTHSLFGDMDIRFSSEVLGSYTASLQELRDLFRKKGKVSQISLLFNSGCKPALQNITVNGHSIQSLTECELVCLYEQLITERKRCAGFWNQCMTPHGVSSFDALDPKEPESIAKNYIPLIRKYLDWYETEYSGIAKLLHDIGIPEDIFFERRITDTDFDFMRKILTSLKDDVPSFCNICLCFSEFAKHREILAAAGHLLEDGSRSESQACRALLKAIDTNDSGSYEKSYHTLSCLFDKYRLQKERNEKLGKIESVAPQWAEAIRNRIGIHGESKVPSTIADAWKWKQLAALVDELTSQSFREWQTKSLELSQAYRETTAKYAEKSAWLHLLKKTEGDISLRQALVGWMQTIQKIGKGLGKNAPALKAEAREAMKKCREAVPAWIMPVNRALESFDPKKSKFDIIIIDEASQSDLSSLAILYMGKKFIIVGDDKQVSPLAIGTQTALVQKLQAAHIKNKIPNSHLYDGTTSIYDIAQQTFSSLMLKEHFRCVPEIIGFSNQLSYDNEIKPLRDASSSHLLPAVVNHKVANGRRAGKKKLNENEAKEIVALLQACMRQPEYIGKTFGIISLLGDEQADTIQRLIEDSIDRREIVDRNILCGNAANFQGDERDVIFLSLVSSGGKKGPLRLFSNGAKDVYKKRYNVAASRAKDQLWVVHSLDLANDLQSGDLRKELIGYATNPQSYQKRQEDIEKKSDSPFEALVATTLVQKGYHIVQQWQAGAYRIDIVVICGNKKIAIECDGERYHSTEEQICKDMERQTILERIGWRFIRIRGSEYFRNPEKTMERVIGILDDHQIYPESAMTSMPDEPERRTELLERVELLAPQILAEMNKPNAPDMDTISYALDPKSKRRRKRQKEFDEFFGEIGDL